MERWPLFPERIKKTRKRGNFRLWLVKPGNVTSSRGPGSRETYKTRDKMGPIFKDVSELRTSSAPAGVRSLSSRYPVGGSCVYRGPDSEVPRQVTEMFLLQHVSTYYFTRHSVNTFLWVDIGPDRFGKVQLSVSMVQKGSCSCKVKIWRTKIWCLENHGNQRSSSSSCQ